ncbi:hydroxymethylglutaryl-CoA lyase, partial [Streptomyces sp900105755]
MTCSPGALTAELPGEHLPPVPLHEVGARDGLQNEKTAVPTSVKA